jgi:hypothetical protein
MNLKIGQGTSSQAPSLKLGFRTQGLNKAGVTQTGEVILRYKKKNSSEIVKKPYTVTFTSKASDPTQNQPAGKFYYASDPITLTGVNLSEAERLSTSGTFGTGIEVYVKTPTTLRKKLGEIIYESNQAPIRLQGYFLADNQQLMVGDFDRYIDEEVNQENKFRLTDVTKMKNQYTRVSTPVNDLNREYDINFDGTFNLVDVSQIIDNYRQILLEGDTP